MNTFEKHDGKVWALDISPYTQEGKVYLASGGNDSLLYIWKDVTEVYNLYKCYRKYQKNNNNKYIKSNLRCNNYPTSLEKRDIEKLHY